MWFDQEHAIEGVLITILTNKEIKGYGRIYEGLTQKSS